MSAAASPPADRPALQQLLDRLAAFDQGGTQERPPLTGPHGLLDALRCDIAQHPETLALDDAAIERTVAALSRHEIAAGDATGSARIALLVARLLVPHPDLSIDAEVDRLLDLVRGQAVLAATGAGAVTTDVIGALPPGLPVHKLLWALEGRDAEPAIGHVASLAMHLAGHDPKVLRRTTVSVALVERTSYLPARGIVGDLTLEELDHGPVGAFPHPTAMFGLATSSTQLGAAIERARHHVDPDGTRSLRWQVAVDGHPPARIEGPSLAAGWAVAATELVARERRRIRLRAVDARTTITGDVLDGGALGPIEGVVLKADAARAAGKTAFLYPGANAAELPAERTGSFARIPATSVSAAHEAARTAYDRSVWVVAAAVVVVLAVATASFVQYRNFDERRRADQAELAATERRTAAKELLATASDLRASDLRTSLLLTLESYELDPDPETRAQLTRALGAGTSLRKVLPADGEVVAIEPVRPVSEADSDAWQLALLDDEGTIAYRSVETGELLATQRAADEPVTAIAANPVVPWMLTASAEGIRQVRVASDDRVGSVPSLSPGTCDQGEQVLLAISHDGTRAAAARGSTFCVWDLLTGARIASLSVDEVPLSGDEPEPEEGNPAIGPITALAFGQERSTVLVGSTSLISAVDLDQFEREDFPIDSGFETTSIVAFEADTSGRSATLATTDNQLFAKFEDQARFEPVPLEETTVRRVDANVDGSVIMATLGSGVYQLDPAAGFQPSSIPEALAHRSGDTARADVALIDEFDGGVVATFGGTAPVLLGGRSPAQQRVTIDDILATGLSAAEDGSVVVTFDRTSVRAYRTEGSERLDLSSIGDATSLDVPTEIDGQEVRIKDVFFPAGAGNDFVVYGFNYVARDDATTSFARVFDGETLRPKKDLILPSGVQRQVSWIADAGAQIVAVDVAGRYTTFDVDSWDPADAGKLPVEAPHVVDLDPTNRVLAVSAIEVDDNGESIEPPRGTVSFYRFPSMDPIGAPLPAPGDAAWNLAFIDDETLLSHGIDDRLYEFSAYRTSGGETRWQAAPYDLTGEDAVDWFLPSQDGERVGLVSGTEVTVHDTADLDSGGVVLSTGAAELGLMLLIRDGNTVVVSTDAGAGVWDLPDDDLEAQVCAVVSQGLTTAEWEEHLGDLPYVERCTEAPASDQPERPEDETDEAIEAPSAEDGWFEDSDAEPVPASASTCADFDELRPTSCITYGDEDAPFALVSVFDAEADADVTTHWSEQGRTWEPLGQLSDPYGSAELTTVQPSEGPTQAVVLFIPGNYDLTLVLDEGEEVLLEEASEVVGDTIVTTNMVWRGMQSRAGINAYQRVERRWDGTSWEVIGIAPVPVGSWASESEILQPDGIAGVRLGDRFDAAVFAVEAVIEGPTQDAGAVTRRWTDGLSETAQQPWTEREPLDLVETCWSQQLCLYGDDAGRFVGWRYDAGQPTASADTVSPAADRLRLSTAEGLGLAGTWPDEVRDRWPEGAVDSGVGLGSIVVGVVHPRGAVAAPTDNPSFISGDPVLAGANDERVFTIGGQEVRIGFGQGVRASWTEQEDRLVLSEWVGPGSISVSARSTSGSTRLLGALPGPGGADWTLTVCTPDEDVVVVAAGEGSRRSWRATERGLVATDSSTTC